MNEITIGSRWRAGHHVRRELDGTYEEVNCPRPSARAGLRLEQEMYASELTSWLIGAVLVFLLAATVISAGAPQAVVEVAAILGIMAMAVLVGLVPWAIWGHPK